MCFCNLKSTPLLFLMSHLFTVLGSSLSSVYWKNNTFSYYAGYVNELFIALQHSISTELISRLTGQDIRTLFDVLVQRFPHPPYWEDNSLAVLKLLFPMFLMLSTSYSAINIVRAIVVEKELQLKVIKCVSSYILSPSSYFLNLIQAFTYLTKLYLQEYITLILLSQ